MSGWIQELRRETIRRRICCICGKRYFKTRWFRYWYLSHEQFSYRNDSGYHCFPCHNRIYRQLKGITGTHLKTRINDITIESILDCYMFIDIYNILPSIKFPEIIYPVSYCSYYFGKFEGVFIIPNYNEEDKEKMIDYMTELIDKAENLR